MEFQRFKALETVMKFSKIIVSLVVFLNTAFAFTVLYVLLKTCGEPSTLIVSWFAFTTGEVLMLAGIKKKIIKNDEECD